MTNFLLVGLGRWGLNHLRVLRSLPVNLFACDMRPESLAAASECGVPSEQCSPDYRDFLERVEAVAVVTPVQNHYQICREFLEAGKDVFVEKPMTLKSSEAHDLARRAKQAGCILQVGHIFRFDSASEWLRKAVQAGDFGHVRILRGNFSGFKRPRRDAGVGFSDAIHFVDLFNYLLGASPVRVTAFMHDFLGRGMDDGAMISLEYDLPGGPAWGVVEANYFLPGKFREVTLIGTELSAVCDYNVSQYKIKTFANHHRFRGQDCVAEEGALHQIESPPEEPLLAEIRSFLEARRTRQPPRADGWVGYEAVRILEAAMESASTGRRVDLAPPPVH